MRRHDLLPGLVTLAWAFAAVAAWCVPAHAVRASSRAPRSATLAPAPRTAADSVRAAAGAPARADWDELRLRRAVAEQRLGRARGVIENLEAIDFASPSFEGADRAAYLLGLAYLEQGSGERLAALVTSVAAWGKKSLYTRWLAQLQHLEDADGAGAGAGGAALAAWRHALELEAAGQDDDAALTEASSADTSTTLGRDLAGAARVRLATRALARNQDPRPMLEAVPAGSRFATRARHMLALVALEHGETGRGRALLGSVLADSTYSDRRQAQLALAAGDMDSARWERAQQSYDAVDRDWHAEHDALQTMHAQNAYAPLWTGWLENSALSNGLWLDPEPARALARQLAVASLDLDAHPGQAPPTPMLPRPAAGMRWSVAPPTPREWNTLDSSARRFAASGADAERARWEAATERERLEQLRRYFAAGGRRAAAEADTLRARSALLDSLRGTLDALYARLASVRDESIRRVGLRTAAILEQCENDLLWLRGMRRFHMEGPYAAISSPAPPNLPNGGTLVVAEEELARAVRDVAERVAREAPGRIRLSYEKAWGPSLIDRIVAFGPEAHRSLTWARALGGTIDSSLAAAGTSERLRRLELRAAALDRSTDSLRAADQALSTRIARTAVERTLAAMESEREGIDYGLAVSTYALGVRLGEGADSAGAARVMPRAGNAAAEAAGVAENAEAQHWRVLGIDRLRAFLASHPKSAARGEMRFRLTDLLLVEARRDFRERMARYLDDHGAGPRGALPVLEAAPALALYRTILAEDRDFPHRDAVLFNAGMILADDGDDGARAMFSELVTSHPGSRYGQEAWLRMGDLEFADRRFAEAVTRYQHAVEGRDPSMQVIALYKMGWAHYDQEHFAEAVESFRGVLDLYVGADSSRIQVDVEREAEGDLVQTLARAGGAEAYTRAFATPATRPYEKRVLLALGQHFRRYSLLGPAAAADELFLARYPLDPDALVSAARMVETHERAGRPIDARDARLRYAPVFAPASPWAGAQTSDSVRTAGAEFARASWKTVALEHHRAARAKNDATEWREALRLYEVLVARWPDDPERATIEMNAGEAGARLARYPEALAHYDAAARIGGDRLAAQAMWQRVVVTDDWYETSRGGRTAPGSDTLARAVLQAADQLLERFPSHPKRADLLWREGQLSFAHGWFERAADDFGHLAARDPADARAPRAAVLRADALFRIARFESAGEAYEQALGAAQRAGDDSLARRAERAIPVCAYREAEAAVAADSTNHARHAALFEKVAARWPRYEHAPLAQYRAGLSYLAAGANRDAVQAMQALIRNFPSSEYVRDARLQIAKTLEADGEKERAGDAYADFAAHEAGDKSARDAWLKAGDLFAAAGRTARADSVRLDYVRRYPDDQPAAMEIYEGFARRDLQGVGPGHPISSLLDAPRPVAPKTATGAKAARAPLGPPRSRLAEYLRRAAGHPELAARDIPAQVRFLQGEEAAAACAAMPLRQPLDKSIKARQKLLDQALARYRECVALEVSEWAHAATFRIGELLIGFGEALEKSERPADLSGADLQGYQDVLAEQAGVFYDRGEGVWTELLKKGAAPGSTARAAGDPKKNPGDAKPEDPWVQKARTSLWSRIGSRFAFLPELEFPTITASAPESGRSREPHAQARPTPAPGQANLAAPREDNPR